MHKNKQGHESFKVFNFQICEIAEEVKSFKKVKRNYQGQLIWLNWKKLFG